MAKKSKKNPEIIKLKKQFNDKLEEFNNACLIEKIKILDESEKRAIDIVQKEKKKERLMKVALFVLFVSIMILLDVKDDGIILQMAQLAFGM
jgi:hypothetical protein